MHWQLAICCVLHKLSAQHSFKVTIKVLRVEVLKKRVHNKNNVKPTAIASFKKKIIRK